MKLLAPSAFLRLPTLVIGLVTLAAVLLMIFEVRLVAQERSAQPVSKRNINEPCRLEAMDLLARDLTEASDWRRVAEQKRVELVHDTVWVSIVLDRSGSDAFVQRYADRITFTSRPIEFFQGRPQIGALVPVSLLCEISVQPEVRTISARSPMNLD